LGSTAGGWSLHHHAISGFKADKRKDFLYGIVGERLCIEVFLLKDVCETGQTGKVGRVGQVLFSCFPGGFARVRMVPR
jgi:hypothetical protein